MLPHHPAKLRAVRQRGASTIEFYILAFWLLIPLLMAVLQMGLFIVAKNTVNVATLGAARAGAASGVDIAAMRRAFVVGVAPLYGAKGFAHSGSPGLSEISAANYPKVAGAATLLAYADLQIPLANEILVLNPTRAAFDDFGITRKPRNKRIIPVDNLFADNKIGSKSGQRRSDALLLKIEARYCYRMDIPIIDTVVIEVLSRLNPNAKDQACFTLNGVPILAQAVVRMTVPPVQSTIFR